MVSRGKSIEYFIVVVMMMVWKKILLNQSTWRARDLLLYSDKIWLERVQKKRVTKQRATRTIKRRKKEKREWKFVFHFFSPVIIKLVHHLCLSYQESRRDSLVRTEGELAMTSPFPSRSRLSRSSLSTPNRVNAGFGSSGNNLSRSPSTPYDIYQRNYSPLPSTSSSSTSLPASAFLPSSTSQPALGAYRRNAGFGSPGVGRSPRYSQAGTGTSTDVSSPRPSSGSHRPLTSRTPKFIRRKSLKQR
jgi:hypothetical protein